MISRIGLPGIFVLLGKPIHMRFDKNVNRPSAKDDLKVFPEGLFSWNSLPGFEERFHTPFGSWRNGVQRSGSLVDLCLLSSMYFTTGAIATAKSMGHVCRLLLLPADINDFLLIKIP